MIGRLCPHYKECVNNSHCMNCDGELLYKPSKKEHKETRQKRKGQKTEKKAVNSLNKTIKKKIEKAYNKNKQKLTPNSGAGHIKGDSIASDLILEMKERNKVLKGGNKSISIQKEWLDKLRKEASGKYYSLVFSFGENEEDLYAIIDYNTLSEMYSDIVYLKERLNELENNN